MASKKIEVPVKPIISRVPLPISDSALVIDLPDGQKLVIGKMNQGTVIEVATWRGVGRPDSRTNRMMFGMSSAEIDEEANEPHHEQSALASSANIFVRVLTYPIEIVKWLFNIQSAPKPNSARKGGKKLIIEPKPATTFVDSQGGAAPVQEAAQKQKMAIAASLAHIQKVLSAQVVIAQKLLTKSAQSAKKEVRTPSTESESIDIDQWLASITAKTKKPSSAESSKSLPKKSQKK